MTIGSSWKSCSPSAHLLLRGPAPNRPQNNTGVWPGGWGPLGQTIRVFRDFSRSFS